MKTQWTKALRSKSAENYLGKEKKSNRNTGGTTRAK